MICGGASDAELMTLPQDHPVWTPNMLLAPQGKRGKDGSSFHKNFFRLPGLQPDSEQGMCSQGGHFGGGF
jgi:hypothetical protein|tara:strand:+ start:470 stop:679 length:210 start_codon:yes stop_codon:yes gene_type:complete